MQLSLIKTDRDSLEADKQAVNEKLQEVLKMQDETKAILNRIKEVEAREEAIKEKEKANEARIHEINQLSAAAKAETVRMNLRDIEQKKKDKELKQREDNVKILEAKV
jgi:uncharacterized protein (DUF3084 family)